MRKVAVLALLLAPAAAAENDTLARIEADSTKKRELGRGEDYLEDYFKYLASDRRGSAEQAAKAMRGFLDWLEESPAKLGVNLAKDPEALMALFDRGRAAELENPAKGRAGYASKDVPGMERNFEYAFWVPRSYDPRTPPSLPLVVSLHGRVVNPSHPAFRPRGAQATERGRVPIHDYWDGNPAGENAVVIAPSGLPTGFLFGDAHFEDLRTLMIAVGEGLTTLRVDWQRVFLEVEGSGLRVACEQPFVFAGLILRDPERSDGAPFLPEDQMFLLGNLNALPVLYIADEQRWDEVGKPFADGLAALYEGWGKPENLVVLKTARDANGALKGDPAKVVEFLNTHRRTSGRKEFSWRFFDPNTINPLPIELTLANFAYDEDAPLEKTAGSLTFKAEQKTEHDADGNPKPYNLVTVDVTEAEGLRLMLADTYLDLDLPLTVIVNGKVMLDKVPVERNISYFVETLLPRCFFMFPYMGSVEVKDVAHKPQYVAPPPPPEEDAQAPGEGEDAAGGTDAGAQDAAGEDDPQGAADK